MWHNCFAETDQTQHDQGSDGWGTVSYEFGIPVLYCVPCRFSHCFCHPTRPFSLFLYFIALPSFYVNYAIILYDLPIYCVCCLYPSLEYKCFMKCGSLFCSLIYPEHPEHILAHNGYSDIWWMNEWTNEFLGTLKSEDHCRGCCGKRQS